VWLLLDEILLPGYRRVPIRDLAHARYWIDEP
jgi:hypothetical protein